MQESSLTPSSSGGVQSCYIDVAGGCIKDRANHQVIQRLPRCRRRECTILTELYFAAQTPKLGLQALELVIIWPNWLDTSVSLRSLSDQPLQVRWRINKDLNPFGWEVTSNGFRYPLRLLSCGNPMPISLQCVVALLLEMESLMREGRFTKAVCVALEILKKHPENRQALHVIATGAFLYGVEVDPHVLIHAATATYAYYNALCKGVEKLGKLHEREPRKGRYQYVLDFVEGMLEPQIQAFKEQSLDVKVAQYVNRCERKGGQCE